MGSTVMMLTSGGQRGDAARCRALGVGGYLVKPVSQSELFDANEALPASGMAADLLGCAFGHVNWEHLADAWLEVVEGYESSGRAQATE